MVEDSIRIINDLDIEIKDLESEIDKNKLINKGIKSNIYKKMMILKQIDNILCNEDIQ